MLPIRIFFGFIFAACFLPARLLSLRFRVTETRCCRSWKSYRNGGFKTNAAVELAQKDAFEFQSRISLTGYFGRLEDPSSFLLDLFHPSLSQGASETQMNSHLSSLLINFVIWFFLEVIFLFFMVKSWCFSSYRNFDGFTWVLGQSCCFSVFLKFFFFYEV